MNIYTYIHSWETSYLLKVGPEGGSRIHICDARIIVCELYLITIDVYNADIRVRVIRITALVR